MKKNYSIRPKFEGNHIDIEVQGTYTSAEAVGLALAILDAARKQGVTVTDSTGAGVDV